MVTPFGLGRASGSSASFRIRIARRLVTVDIEARRRAFSAEIAAIAQRKSAGLSGRAHAARRSNHFQ
jgi:phage tail tape-measure protein